jgi:low temperature requirement protein LtrA
VVRLLDIGIKADRADERMTSGADKLLRKPDQPQRATFLELFFDLAFVVALTRLSQVLINDLSWRGAFQTLVLLLGSWWVWFITTAVTDRYDPWQPAIQLLVIATLIGSLVLAAAAPEAFGEQGLILASVYVGIQVGRSLLLLLAVQGREQRRRVVRSLFWWGVSAVPWIAGGFASGSARGALWTLAVTVDYTGFAIGWPTPAMGRSPRSEWAVAAEHLTERYRQFFIIALGELILITTVTLGGDGFTADRMAAFVVSITTTVLFWRIYLSPTGELLTEAIEVSPDRLRPALSAALAHLVMMAGIVATAVGAERVIGHPLGRTAPGWIAVILGGPALFLAGRIGFAYVVFRQMSIAQPIGLPVLAVLAPVMFLVPPLVVALTATAVLTGITVADTVRNRRRPPQPPAAPSGRS